MLGDVPCYEMRFIPEAYGVFIKRTCQFGAQQVALLVSMPRNGRSDADLAPLYDLAAAFFTSLSPPKP
jgi:hypothetical protein